MMSDIDQLTGADLTDAELAELEEELAGKWSDCATARLVAELRRRRAAEKELATAIASSEHWRAKYGEAEQRVRELEKRRPWITESEE